MENKNTGNSYSGVPVTGKRMNFLSSMNVNKKEDNQRLDEDSNLETLIKVNNRDILGEFLRETEDDMVAQVTSDLMSNKNINVSELLATNKKLSEERKQAWLGRGVRPGMTEDEISDILLIKKEKEDNPKLNAVCEDLSAFGLTDKQVIETVEKTKLQNNVVDTLNKDKLELYLKQNTPYTVMQKLLSQNGLSADLKGAFVCGDDKVANHLLSMLIDKHNPGTIQLLTSKLCVLAEEIKIVLTNKLTDKVKEGVDYMVTDFLAYKKRIAKSANMNIAEFEEMVDAWSIDYCSVNLKKLLACISERKKGLDLHINISTRVEQRAILEFKSNSFSTDLFCIFANYLQPEMTAEFILDLTEFDTNLSVWSQLVQGNKIKAERKYHEAVSINSIRKDTNLDDKSELNIEVIKGSLGRKNKSDKLPVVGKNSVMKQSGINTELSNLKAVNDQSARDRIMTTCCRNVQQERLGLAIRAMRKSLPHEIWTDKIKYNDYFANTQNAAFMAFDIYFDRRGLGAKSGRTLLGLLCILIKLEKGVRRNLSNWLHVFKNTLEFMETVLSLVIVFLNLENDSDLLDFFLSSNVISSAKNKFNGLVRFEIIMSSLHLQSYDKSSLLTEMRSYKHNTSAIWLSLKSVLSSTKGLSTGGFLLGFTMAIGKLMHMLNGNTFSDDSVEVEDTIYNDFIQVLPPVETSQPSNEDILATNLEGRHNKDIRVVDTLIDKVVDNTELGLNFNLTFPDKPEGDKVYYEDLASSSLGPALNYVLAIFDKSTGPGWSSFATLGQDDKGKYIVNTYYPTNFKNNLEALTTRHDVRYFNARNEEEKKFADYLMDREGKLLLSENKLSAYEEVQVQAVLLLFDLFSKVSSLENKDRQHLLQTIGRLHNRELNIKTESFLRDLKLENSEFKNLVEGVITPVTEAPISRKRVGVGLNWRTSFLIMLFFLGLSFADDWSVDNVERNRLMHALNGNFDSYTFVTDYVTDNSELPEVVKKMPAIKRLLETLKICDYFEAGYSWPKGSLSEMEHSLYVKTPLSTEQMVDRFDTTNWMSACPFNEMFSLFFWGTTAQTNVFHATNQAIAAPPKIQLSGSLLETITLAKYMQEIVAGFRNGELTQISSSLRSTRVNIAGELLQNLVFDTLISAGSNHLVKASPDVLIKILLYSISTSLFAYGGQSFVDRMVAREWLDINTANFSAANVLPHFWCNTVMGGNVLASGANRNTLVVGLVDGVTATTLFVTGSIVLNDQNGINPVIFTIEKTVDECFVIPIRVEDILYPDYLYDLVFIHGGFPMYTNNYDISTVDQAGIFSGNSYRFHQALGIVGNSQGYVWAATSKVLFVVSDYGNSGGTTSGVRSASVLQTLVPMNRYNNLNWSATRNIPLASSLDRAWTNTCKYSSEDTINEAMGVVALTLRHTSCNGEVLQNPNNLGLTPSLYQSYHTTLPLQVFAPSHSVAVQLTNLQSVSIPQLLMVNCIADFNGSDPQVFGAGNQGCVPSNTGNSSMIVPSGDYRVEYLKRAGIWSVIAAKPVLLGEILSKIYVKANKAVNMSKLIMGKLGLTNAALQMPVNSDVYNMRLIVTKALFHLFLGDRGNSYQYSLRIRVNPALAWTPFFEVNYNCYLPFGQAKYYFPEDSGMEDVRKHDFKVFDIATVSAPYRLTKKIASTSIVKDSADLASKVHTLMHFMYGSTTEVGVFSWQSGNYGNSFIGMVTNKSTIMGAMVEAGFAIMAYPVELPRCVVAYCGYSGFGQLVNTASDVIIKFNDVYGIPNNFGLVFRNTAGGTDYLPSFKKRFSSLSVFSTSIISRFSYVDELLPDDDNLIKEKTDAKTDTIIDVSGNEQKK